MATLGPFESLRSFPLRRDACVNLEWKICKVPCCAADYEPTPKFVGNLGILIHLSVAALS